MDTGVDIFLISAAIVAAIVLFRIAVNKLANKGIDAVQKKIAEKKTDEHTDHVGEEQNLSDLYKNDGDN